MRMLLAISIIALLALLWASISIAQHVREARERRRKLTDYDGPVEVASSLPPPSFDNKPERADWAYFNKNMGDLSDPYQSPRARPKARTEQ